MSWSFRKVGTNHHTLKLAVEAETGCPKVIREEIGKRIDGAHLTKGQAIYVASHGHLEEGSDRPYNGTGEIKITVAVLPLIDTP
jgi:hypothetical protein